MNSNVVPTKKELVDLFFRVLWTFISAALAGTVGVAFLDIGALQAMALAGLSGAANVLLVYARLKLGTIEPPKGA